LNPSFCAEDTRKTDCRATIRAVSRIKKTFISNAAPTEERKPRRRAIKSSALQELLHVMWADWNFPNRRKKITWKIRGSGLPLPNTRGKYVIHISLRSPFQPFLVPINSTFLYINACGYYARAYQFTKAAHLLKLTMHINLSHPSRNPFRMRNLYGTVYLKIKTGMHLWNGELSRHFTFGNTSVSNRYIWSYRNNIDVCVILLITFR